LGEVGNKEGSLYDVKRKNGLHTVHHVEGGVASRLASSGAIGPKCKGCNHQPSGFVAFACLDDGFADRTVLSFDDAIGLGVVRRYMDVSDAILVSKPVKCCDVCGAVVSDDLFHCSPPAQNLFEDKGADRVASFCVERVPLRPGCE